MWHGIYSAAKDLLVGTLEASGLLWRQMDKRLSGKVLVLMYHRVLPELGRDSFSAPGIIVTPDTFDRHLGWIRAHLYPLTPVEFDQILAGSRSPPRRACLVTFDDGWYDNLVYALPALSRHSVPALLFAATDFIGASQCFWQERLARLFYAAWQAGSRASGLLERVGAATPLNLSRTAARREIRDAVTRKKGLSPCEIKSLVQAVEDALSELRIALPRHFGDDRFLSWAELQHLTASRLVTVGSHAMSHFPLPRLPQDVMEAELRRSRAILEARLNTGVDWFAYPNGDYDATSVAMVAASGYRGAFTTQNGAVAPGQDAFTLRRVNMHEGATHTLGRFLSCISGKQ